MIRAKKQANSIFSVIKAPFDFEILSPYFRLLFTAIRLN